MSIMAIQPETPCRATPMDLATEYIRDEPAFLSSQQFGPFVRQGDGGGASLLIGDQAGISLIRPGLGMLDYRMASMARPGDLVIVRRRVHDFERYLEEYLGMTDVQFWQANADDPRPVSVQLRQEAEFRDRLCAYARKAESLTFKPYYTTGHDWHLARTIGQYLGCRVHICGPAPRIAQRANDKLWFARLARRVLGTSATPPTWAAYGPAATAGLVRRIARQAPQVIVKIPDSAGSAGNVRLESGDVTAMPLGELRLFLLVRLRARGWHDQYPLLVGVWDRNMQHSPSVQLWLPHPQNGPPRVDGIFDQRVRGLEQRFVGAAPSKLSRSLQHALRRQACRIASVLQSLGYFGACSFDAVICDKGTIHWIECNGRWGGVSIPLAAVGQRLIAPNAAGLLIIQEKLPDLRFDAAETIERLRTLLYHHKTRRQGLVLLSPPDPAGPWTFNAVAIADTAAVSCALIDEALARLATA